LTANSVIKRNTSHPILSLWTNKKGGDKIRLFRARNELDEADFIVGQIDTLITKGYEFSDVCVLYRTNAQSRVLEEALLHAGIPYVLVGGVRFYERREIKDVLSFLRLLANPKDPVSKNRAEKLGIRRFENLRAAKG
jgi:DNA helicase-2/ATP-dependent DNA helicase PcrA